MPPNRRLHLERDYRMGLSGVASGNEKDLSASNVANGIGHCARAQACGQTGHRAAVSEAGAVIDVVGSDYSARDLLKEVVLLVRAFRRDQEANGVGTVLFLDLNQAL